MEHDAVVAFGQGLQPEDEVILEATGNTSAIVRLLTPFVNRVIIANPLQVKAIAHARVKTDKVDAKILAQLHAAGFLPEVWAADDDTLHLRRLVSERDATVRSIRRVKSRVQAILHANLVPKYAGHLFGKGGRKWLSKVPLPKQERDLLGRHLDELDWLTTKLEDLEKVLIRMSLDDDRTRKLMSVVGISSVIATAVIASIGDISRFQSPEKLASYFGLTPRVRQSGERGAIHGRISKQGKRDRPDHADRSRLGRSFRPGSSEGLLPTRQRQERGKRRCSCDCPEDRKSDLAPSYQRRTLPMGTPCLCGDEDAQAGIAGRCAKSTLKSRTRSGLLDQGTATPRNGTGRKRRGRLCQDGRSLARKAAKTQRNLKKGLFNNIRIKFDAAIVEE